jgi:hypothetical protein
VVGDQDPLAEDFFFQGTAGGLVDLPGQPQGGGGVAGQVGAQHPGDPAGGADAVDVGFDFATCPAGPAAGEPVGEFAELAGGFAQGLGEADLLGGVQAG